MFSEDFPMRPVQSPDNILALELLDVVKCQNRIRSTNSLLVRRDASGFWTFGQIEIQPGGLGNDDGTLNHILEFSDVTNT